DSFYFSGLRAGKMQECMTDPAIHVPGLSEPYKTRFLYPELAVSALNFRKPDASSQPSLYVPAFPR
ncbi:MAG: hypothetical protein ABFS02_14145, partial [Pseudomonadota bacterium]